MAKNENPFAIRKSPVEIISTQAISLDDYVKRGGDGCADTVVRTHCVTNRN